MGETSNPTKTKYFYVGKSCCVVGSLPSKILRHRKNYTSSSFYSKMLTFSDISPQKGKYRMQMQKDASCLLFSIVVVCVLEGCRRGLLVGFLICRKQNGSILETKFSSVSSGPNPLLMEECPHELFFNPLNLKAPTHSQAGPLQPYPKHVNTT